MNSRPVVCHEIRHWREIRDRLEQDGRSIGFVPTMGALHVGHASLLERARRENDVVVLSIYVNPTQFDNKQDLEKYPIMLEKDLEVASRCGVDFVLAPTYREIYPDNYRYKVSESDLSTRLCGAHRPGHFDGVLTVVMKLLNLVGADRAYFGEKDHQQLQLIKGMVDAFFMTTSIVPCPTVREADGLALSSRNLNLSAEARAKAPLFAKALRESTTAELAKAALGSAGFDVDYVEDIANRRYGAVKIGGVRLIDNVEK